MTVNNLNVVKYSNHLLHCSLYEDGNAFKVLVSFTDDETPTLSVCRSLEVPEDSL